MKVGIMQPYLFPYIGYFQLIKSVDKFVIYDDVQFIKGGWINRNNILVNNKKTNFVINLKNDSYTLNINERYITDKWEYERKKMIKTLNLAYAKAPNYKEAMPVLESILSQSNDKNIADFITFSLKKICEYLEIDTEFIISSQLEKENELKGQDKVIHIVKKIGGNKYINSYGGMELYSKEDFKDDGIELLFIKPQKIEYKQFNEEFISNLSIVDILMFNSKESIIDMLDNYEVL